VFALTGELTAKERRVLEGARWGISAIVLWELAKLVQIGRIEVDLNDGEVTRILSSLTIWPIDLAVALQSTRMDFKGDPADELIAATSVVHRVPLVTRDKTIRGSRLVSLA
jgi:PIN domain nuclease of toxin-antitoxin system